MDKLLKLACLLYKRQNYSFSGVGLAVDFGAPSKLNMAGKCQCHSA